MFGGGIRKQCMHSVAERSAEQRADQGEKNPHATIAQSDQPATGILPGCGHTSERRLELVGAQCELGRQAEVEEDRERNDAPAPGD